MFRLFLLFFTFFLFLQTVVTSIRGDTGDERLSVPMLHSDDTKYKILRRLVAPKNMEGGFRGGFVVGNFYLRFSLGFLLLSMAAAAVVRTKRMAI